MQRAVDTKSFIDDEAEDASGNDSADDEDDLDNSFIDDEDKNV